MKKIFLAASTLFTVGIATCAPAYADAAGYLRALDAAGLLSHNNGSYCNMIDGACNGQFDSTDAALGAGKWVCDQLAGGKSTSLIMDWMSHGEGLMPSAYNAKVITNAAIANLCPNYAGGQS